MEIKAESVRELRENTGAGIMDCKKALQESAGNLGKAVDYLRLKGLAQASRKEGRVVTEGLVGSYLHGGGKIGVLVELNCETDFVARTSEFQNLLKDLSMQIAATNPRYIRREDVPEEELGKERQIFHQQAIESGKPEKVIDKIVNGKVERFYSEVCLLEQDFIKDSDRQVGDIIKESVGRLGENIQVRRFVRYLVGEGAVNQS